MSDNAKGVPASLDVLQNYFDDLLTPEAGDKPVPEPLPFEHKSTKVLPLQSELDEKHPFKNEHESSYQERSQRVAERLAKSRLARLLTSVAEADETISERRPAVATEVRNDIVVESRLRQEPLISVPKTTSRESKNSDVDTPEPLAKTPVIEDEKLAWLENGRPAWAQERFDVLLFEVSGLTLAVPLITLGQIQPLTDELTPLFGQADWFMGLQPTSAGQVNTVNTAKFVMPERYDESFLKTAKYVVSIDGLPWGLAVCAVNQPISLAPEDVNWRGDRSKRPWLAGTVKEQRCALLDIPTMGKILQDLDSNGGRGD